MKRQISLVIALLVSFLLMFSPIARAEEMKPQTFSTSEPVELKVVEIPQDKNKADSPSEVKGEAPAIDKPGLSAKGCVICPDGRWGRWAYADSLDYQSCLATCN
ncbi:MAG: hypothetical protein KME54_04055 [Tolypothrix brevis GSE-NOS-MK-07-07A]|jgi:hypothetical protein|nr:hypothetical protein [Tolypothrix brevis GSE-NOS-MK-07-07A]